MTRHPIGINQRQETDDTRVMTFLKQMGGVRAHLCHFDNGALQRMHQYKAWVDLLIWRPRDDTQEKLFRTYADPAQYVRNCRAQMLGRGFKEGDLWLHLHNEPEWSFWMIDWEYKAALAAVALGMKVVMLNPSVGTPNPDQLPMAEKIIRMAADHPDQIILGCHEYFSVYGHRKRPWYLYRWSFWEKYRLDKGIDPVRYLITEFGADNIADDGDYARQFARYGQVPRGVHELGPAWERTYNNPEHNKNPKPYPGLDEAYYEQLIQAYSTGNYAEDAIEAALIFGWGNEWPDFDISRMTVLHQRLSEWWQRNKPTAPLEPRPPIVDEPDPPIELPIPTIPPKEGDTKEVEIPITRNEFKALSERMDKLQLEIAALRAQVMQEKVNNSKLRLALAKVLAGETVDNAAGLVA